MAAIVSMGKQKNPYGAATCGGFMNKSHETIYNETFEAWVATAENTSVRGNRNNGVKRLRNTSGIGNSRSWKTNPNLLRVLTASISLALPALLIGEQVHAAPLDPNGTGGGLVLCPNPGSPSMDGAEKKTKGSAFGYLSIQMQAADCEHATLPAFFTLIGSAKDDGSIKDGTPPYVAGLVNDDLLLTGKRVLVKGPTIFNADASMSGSRIADLAPGVEPEDAVNVKQLSTLGADLAKGLGGGAAYEPKAGTVSQPSYTTYNADGTSSNVNSVGAAIDSVNSNGIKYFHASSTGPDSRATGLDSVAAGPNANAAGAYASALGADSIADGNRATAVGSSATATGDYSFALGPVAIAKGKWTTAVGASANAIGDYASALGTSANASGERATAVGQFAEANGERATAAGATAHAIGKRASALGAYANATGEESTAVGSSALASGERSVALGSSAEARYGDSVAIGSNSRTAASLEALKAAAAYTPFAGAAVAGATPDGEVSVGSLDVKRRVTNVAAGAAPTDAVNVSQLSTTASSLSTAVSTAAGSVGGLSTELSTTNSSLGSLSTSVGSIYNTGTKYFHANSTGDDSQALGLDSLAIGQGAISKGDDSAAIGRNAQAGAANSVALGANSVANVGALINYAAFGLAGQQNSTGEVNVGGRQITGVAPGSADQDAVNVQQLRTVANSLSTGLGAAVNGIANLTHSVAGALGAPENIGGSAGNGNGKRPFSLLASVNGDPDGPKAFGPSALQPPSYLIKSADGAPTIEIHNVKDALNGIYAEGTQYFHSNSAQPDSVASGQDSLAVGPQAVASGTGSMAMGVGAQATGSNAVAIGTGAQAGGDGTAIGFGAIAQQIGGVALGAGSVASTAAGVAGYVPQNATASQAEAVKATTSTQAAVSVGDAANGQYRQITGVAAGTVDSDAANVAQLKAASGAVRAGSAQYDTNPDGTVNYGQMTLGNGQAPQGTRISNVAPGVLPNDAVNVSQLLGVQGQVRDVARIAYSGVAMATAMSSMPQAMTPGKSLVSVGIGSYSGYGAIAFGYSLRSDSSKWIYKVSGAVSGNKFNLGMGAGYEW
jgi:autotransporter adhesin